MNKNKNGRWLDGIMGAVIGCGLYSFMVREILRADALLTAVNLGEDTGTVGAICGGLAGLFYGYEDIPANWLAVIERREWIETLCCGTEEQKAGARVGLYE